MGLRRGIAGAAATALDGALAGAMKAAPGATLLIALLLGGCSDSGDGIFDGGISGTGADTGANPDGPLDAANGNDESAVGQGGPPAATRSFVNALDTTGRLAPLVRGLNLSTRPVQVEIDGTSVLTLGPASVDGLASADATGLVPTNTGADRLTVSENVEDGTAFARIDVELSPQSLTTILVQDAPAGADAAVDGIVVTPLRTLARTDDETTALVRVVYAVAPADAAGRLAELSLRPVGGNGAVRLEQAEADSIASDYVALSPGGYELSAEGGGASVPVTLQAGQVVTLVLTDALEDATPGLFRRVVDSDL